MTGFWRVFRYEFFRRLLKRSFFFFAFILPLLGVIGFNAFWAVRGAEQNTPGVGIRPATPAPSLINLPSAPGSGKIGIVDQAGILASDTRVAPFTRYATIEEANAALEAGKLDSYYLILPDYLKTGGVEAWMTRFGFDNVNNGTLRSILSRALTGRLESANPDVIRWLVNRPPEIRNTIVGPVEDKQSASNGAEFALVYGFAIALVFGLFFSSGLLMQSVVEEKESRIVEILVSSVRPWQLLGGKIISLGLLGLLQLVAWGGAIIYILRQIAALIPGYTDLAVPLEKMPVMIAYFVLGYLLFAALYAMVGSLSNSMREGPQLAGVFTLPAMAPLYLIGLFIAQPDGTIPVILSIFPVTAPLAMSMRIMSSTPVPAWHIGLSLILLALTVIGLMWLAGRVFRFGIMLAGQTPKLKDLPKLLRDGAR
jgi:ABC-2 type transport system permease protein